MSEEMRKRMSEEITRAQKLRIEAALLVDRFFRGQVEHVDDFVERSNVVYEWLADGSKKAADNVED